LRENTDKELSGAVDALLAAKDPRRSASAATIEDNVMEKTASQLAFLSAMFDRIGGKQYAN